MNHIQEIIIEKNIVDTIIWHKCVIIIHAFLIYIFGIVCTQNIYFMNLILNDENDEIDGIKFISLIITCCVVLRLLSIMFEDFKIIICMIDLKINITYSHQLK